MKSMVCSDGCRELIELTISPDGYKEAHKVDGPEGCKLQCWDKAKPWSVPMVVGRVRSRWFDLMVVGRVCSKWWVYCSNGSGTASHGVSEVDGLFLMLLRSLCNN